MRDKYYLYIENYTQEFSWDKIKSVMPKRLFNKFSKWMNGQTQILINGKPHVYSYDLGRFLEHERIGTPLEFD